MNAPEVSEQQLSKHDRQDGDRAIECTTEINDRARVDKDRTDLFTPYWMYLGNGARHRSLSIIATSIPLFHRTKFLHSFVARVHNGLFRGSYVTFFDLPPLSFLCRVVVDMIDYSQVNQHFSTDRSGPHNCFIQCFLFFFFSNMVHVWVYI